MKNITSVAYQEGKFLLPFFVTVMELSKTSRKVSVEYIVNEN
ncbi:Hypothetical protein Minf_1836 [Methylacidiphilum infernorum V4]|uniref:Uncharacterized protein n=1 Tax=Methylacidiphilum infernorum (isolate V4) TaxID=481448 RepID=B3DXT8_METI4|nr:Hypothetical protein Minf_1836 [Methylacidiphilum infernorum V4]